MSRLLEGSPEFRNPLVSRNTFTQNREYQIGDPNAISDGDEQGKGENNGSVGSATDIASRNSLEARNLYTKDNEYGIGNA